ncbi:MAG: triose-phosphate isomerase [bacterium]|nr:triose-phosphate isomerase [bacterium]
MRKSFIAGNWKLNKKVSEAVEVSKAIKEGVINLSGADICICPTFTVLKSVYEIIKDSNIALGAQNIWYENQGAYTGEIGASSLLDVGCKYVIIGHSERRKYLNESDETIAHKTLSSLESGLIPIVCIGETLEERESGKAQKIIETQFSGACKNLPADKFSKVVIAYEPVWAIGTGKTATPEIAEEMHKFIRQLIKNRYNKELADNCRILYGGSVTPANIENLMKEPDIDGALVGGASLVPESFIELVKKSQNKQTQ